MCACMAIAIDSWLITFRSTWKFPWIPLKYVYVLMVYYVIQGTIQTSTVVRSNLKWCAIFKRCQHNFENNFWMKWKWIFKNVDRTYKIVSIISNLSVIIMQMSFRKRSIKWKFLFSKIRKLFEILCVESRSYHHNHHHHSSLNKITLFFRTPVRIIFPLSKCDYFVPYFMYVICIP